MKNLPIVELYLIKNRIIREGMQDDPIFEEVCNAIDEKEQMIFEYDTSATGGPAVSGGMGAVVSAQPSSLAGSTIGPGWSGNGGTVGSGDVSMPYNAGTGKRNVQMQMGMNHGGRTGKKSRKKRMTLKTMQQLRNTLSQKQDYTKTGETKKRVMNFNDFYKNDVTTVKESIFQKSNDLKVGDELVCIKNSYDYYNFKVGLKLGRRDLFEKGEKYKITEVNKKSVHVESDLGWETAEDPLNNPDKMYQIFSLEDKPGQYFGYLFNYFKKA